MGHMYLVVDKGNLLFCYFCSVPMRQLNFHSFGLWSPWLPYCFASHFQIESLMQVSNSYFIKELKLFKFAWGFPLFSSFFSAVLLPDNSLLLQVESSYAHLSPLKLVYLIYTAYILKGFLGLKVLLCISNRFKVKMCTVAKYIIMM